MKNLGPKLDEVPMTLQEFLKSFNANMPEDFTHTSEKLLLKFKAEHANLFRKGGAWTLDQHRKRVMDWLPRNIDTV